MRPPHLAILLLIWLFLPGMVYGQTPIHKCKSADGGVVYSQLPCKDEAPVETEKPAREEASESPFPLVDAAEALPLKKAVEDVATSESRAACKKRYRDEIDAIDAEIRREYSKEKDGEYKQRLLALTRKLREC